MIIEREPVLIQMLSSPHPFDRRAWTTVGVCGSNPHAPTISIQQNHKFLQSAPFLLRPTLHLASSTCRVGGLAEFAIC
jgi:hypothetical protein